MGLEGFPLFALLFHSSSLLCVSVSFSAHGQRIRLPCTGGMVILTVSPFAHAQFDFINFISTTFDVFCLIPVAT